METKVCNVCGFEKPSSEFYQPKSKQCKPCVRAAVKALENRPDPVLAADFKKKCRICKKFLPASSFFRRERSVDKLAYDCKDCCKPYRKNQDQHKKMQNVKLPEDYLKQCFQCKRNLPAKMFWYCGVNKDHLKSSCIKCSNNKAIKDKASEQFKTFRREYQKTYRRINKVKEDARDAVKRAVKYGKMPPAILLPCAFSLTHTELRMAEEYHHWKGYEKENRTNVKPVCLGCHSVLSAWERNSSAERLKLIITRHSC